jgi:hypothetical protein
MHRRDEQQNHQEIQAASKGVATAIAQKTAAGNRTRRVDSGSG